MAYLGRIEQKASDIRTSGVQTISGTTTNSVALGWSPVSQQSVILNVNGVSQATNTYTVSGSTLTLDPVTVKFADGDTVEVIGVVDVGETIAPADNTVTFSKISPSSASDSGKYLTNDGTDLSWASIEGGSVSTEGLFFYNYNTISADVTTTVESTKAAFVAGPITIADTFTWTISGELTMI